MDSFDFRLKLIELFIEKYKTIFQEVAIKRPNTTEIINKIFSIICAINNKESKKSHSIVSFAQERRMETIKGCSQRNNTYVECEIPFCVIPCFKIYHLSS